MQALRKFLFEHTMRPADLARALGLQPSYVARVVKGDQEASPGFKWRFYVRYGDNVARSVFTEDFNPPPNGTE